MFHFPKTITSKTITSIGTSIGTALCLIGISTGIVTAQELAPEEVITEREAFDAVFSNPASLILNFQLVGAQLRAGNVKGASATLERILTLSRNNSEAQALLANTQHQLGNVAEARRMATLLLENPDATETQKQNIQTLLERIDDAERLFDIDGVVSIGGGITDNIEGASIGNDALASDTFSEGGYSKRGTSRQFHSRSVSFNVTGRFLAQLPENVSVGLNASARDVDDYDLGDTETLGVNGRYLKTYARTQIVTGGSANAVSVDGRRYMENYSIQATARHILREDLVATGTASNTWSVFHNSFDRTISGNGLPSLRNGQGRNLSFRLTRLLDWIQLGSTLAAGDTTARAEHNEKRNYSASVDASLPLLGGIGSMGIRHSKVKYGGPDSRYSSTVSRRDFTNTVFGSYSMGLGQLIPGLEQPPRISLTAQYGKTKSNIANFSKYAGEVQIQLIQPF